MKANGEHSFREITTQAASWRAALDRTVATSDALRDLFGRHDRQPVVFIGCGSTHYLAQYAAAFAQQQTGRCCRGIPSSELLWQPGSVLTGGARPLVVALSRSGETSETVWALESMRARGCQALAIGCYADSPVGRAATQMLEIPEGREQSFAQTRSFAGMLVAVQAIGAIVSGDQGLLGDLSRLPILADDLIARAEAVAARWGADSTLKRITYLGSGPLFGLANEATVKMKEMSLSLAEGYHFMEFRHGPMALVDREQLVVGLLSERMRQRELDVLRDLAERGARVVALGNHADGQWPGDESFDLCAPVCEAATAALMLPFIQLLAYHRAMAHGLDPDRPRNVSMAIRLDRRDLER